MNFGLRLKPSRNWFGEKSLNLGGPLAGEVYEDDYLGGRDAETVETTCEQDVEFLASLEELVGTRETYSVYRHNCRYFAQMMCGRAKEMYGQ